MIRHAVIATAMAGLALPASTAEETGTPVTLQLTAAQIETLLAGNTAAGTWSGARYRQYFGENGFTVYIPEGGKADEGKWRANAETDVYESWWRSTGWTPYTIVMTNDGYAFVNGEVPEQFDVYEGRQVSW